MDFLGQKLVQVIINVMFVPILGNLVRNCDFMSSARIQKYLLRFVKPLKTRSVDPGHCLFHSFKCVFYHDGYLSTLFSNGISLIAIIIDRTLIISTRKTSIVQIFEETLYYD